MVRVMSRHSFDPSIAQQVGVNAAVIYQNIVWWAEKNAANDKHGHDGLWWTYNSIAAFAELFPYLTGKQIRVALDKLEAAYLIVSGNFNKSPYDRTKWYAPTCLICHSHLPKKANQSAEKGEPIPDSKPDIKPDSLIVDLPIDDPDTVSENDVLEAWNDLAKDCGLPTVKKLNATRKRQLKARLKENTLDEWKQAFAAIERSPFLKGENKTGWRASFDFLLQPSSFTKLIEGQYDQVTR